MQKLNINFFLNYETKTTSKWKTKQYCVIMNTMISLKNKNLHNNHLKL
jgi:hypothetical protein